MNVVSLFNGMGCIWLALDNLGIKVEKRYVSEVDKYANIVNDANYPDSIHLGDVRNVNAKDLGHIDLLAGGSPCQSFSFAGKRNGMSTVCEIEIYTLDHYLQLKSENFEFEGQSYLFWEYMRILNELREINPNIYFLLENVEMGKKWESILSRAIGLNGIHINSSLLSAQNRKRIYWTNIGAEKDGLFGDLVCKIPQPKDKGILLKDIIEHEVDEKYFLKNFKYGFEGMDLESKGNTLRVGGSCSQTDKHNFDLIKVDKKGKIKKDQDKASCFTAGGNSGGNHSDMDIIVHNMFPRSSKSGKGGTGHLTRQDGKTYCLDTGQTNAVEYKCVAMRGRNPENPKSRQSGLETKQMIEERIDGKTNCLTTVQKDNLVLGCDFRSDEGLRIRENGKSNTLMARAREDAYGSGNVIINKVIRRLTPIECCRLQTVREDYFLKDGKPLVSETQIYKQLGNGWTVDVISYILSYLPEKYFKNKIN